MRENGHLIRRMGTECTIMCNSKKDMKVSGQTENARGLAVTCIRMVTNIKEIL
jgi:hypothetical protein